MDMQSVATITSFITSIGTIIAVIVAVIAYLADHERRKKQATIEYYNVISNDITVPLRLEIRKAIGESSYHIYMQIDPNEYRDNKELNQLIIQYCRNMERLAVGIKIKVFDFKVFFRCAGISTIHLYKQIEQFINMRRRVSDDMAYCNEFEELYKRLMLYKLKKNDGVTRHS